MTIKALFNHSIDNEETDLQALIMFLVFEKKVLTMEDDSKELDLYFLEKHNERMNKELHSYRQKLNITYGENFYEVVGDGKTLYVKAKSKIQALNKTEIKNMREINVVDGDMEFIENGTTVTLKELAKNKDGVLGGMDVEGIRRRNTP